MRPELRCNFQVVPDGYFSPRHRVPLKLSVAVTGHPEILEIEGQFTQGSSSGRTLGESVGRNFEMDSSDSSNGTRYHSFRT